jgi:hypothetical protein
MVIIIITGLVALGLLILALRSYRHKRFIDDTPTSKTQGVFIGMSELKGTAESDSPLKSYLAGVKCVYNRWKIEERWSRWVTDAKGRTHRESGWTTVAQGTEFTPFYLKDDAGIIQVNPDGAHVTGKETLDETCTHSDPLYFGKGPLTEITNSEHRRRFHEAALPLHIQLYVMGQAKERRDIVAAEITKDKNALMFLISTHTEKQISTKFGVFFWLWFVLGLFVTGGGIYGQEAVNNSLSAFPWQPVIIAVISYLFAAGLGWLWTVYNSLIGLRQRVKQGWSQVDVQLKRRHDLIPNLVKTIEGYRSHEKETQTLVTELRNQAIATAPGVSGPDFQGLLPLLKATVEQYPELKSNELFLGLQKSLTETEQRIDLARDYFNDVATYYNTRLEIVPDRFVAWMAYMKPELLLYAADFERAPIQVKLVE